MAAPCSSAKPHAEKPKPHCKRYWHCGGQDVPKPMAAHPLFPLNETDVNLGIVTPDRLAGSGLVASLDKDEHRGNVGCGLNLQASAGLRDVLNGARDMMCPEKDFPGLQQTPSR
jgi:hypothetical protein